ncbi:hypothetical protein BH09BAC6_BH09BAC6_26990 [soil metagenome]|jgi:hypothetical protein
MQNKNLIAFFRYAAIFGNVIFVLWILFNAMNEAFKATLVEKFSATGLIGLLVLNCYLLLAAGKAQSHFKQ